MSSSPTARVGAGQVARLAHHLDARTLLAVVPHVDQQDLRSIREAFARWALASRHDWDRWQDAWNEMVGDAPAGYLRYTQDRCSNCRGRRFDPRSLARTGSPVCHVCHGNARGQTVSVLARTFPPPR